jgi:hypothetical protein
LLHLRGIIPAVTGPRDQTGKPQAMEQIVHAGQRVLDPEFLLKNALGLVGTPRADALCLRGLGQEPLLERGLFRDRQLRRPTSLSLGDDRCEAVVSIAVDPPRHESPAAAQNPCDHRGLVTFEGQENGAIAVALLGVSFLTTLLLQLR